MRVIYGLGKKIKNLSRPYVALGIFDGVHLGHQYILKAMLRQAKGAGKNSVCITFYPHPEKILSSKNIFVHLISLEHRLKLIAGLGLDACIVINFNHHFSEISPEHFIELLKKRVDPAAVFVGNNFTFGRGGSGGINLLKVMAERCNFKLKAITPLRLNRRVISSTSIRILIKNGKLDLAKKYLGRDVSVLGRVIKGKRVGRKLGYHTANIDAGNEIIPPAGVYAVKVKMKNKKFNGAAYIGTSPTLHFGYRKPRLEVYIFNFHRNIYNREVEVEFIKKIRQERQFPSLELLSFQIKQDISKARSILR